MRYWQTSRRKLSLERPLVMAILNVTPDSFSDGGQTFVIDDVLRRAEEMVSEGADIIDVGGESTRPGSREVKLEEEVGRVIPVIERLSQLFDRPISIDTTKSEVAESAIEAGAEIVNDISGLRFDEVIADVAAAKSAGLVLMHSRGEFSAMHSQPPVQNIFSEVSSDFHRAIKTARLRGVDKDQIVLDVGIGFGKTAQQNLELLAKLDKLKSEFSQFPFLVGASRKSFIGQVSGDASPNKRLGGSLAAAAVSLWNGASIVRVHDVKETVECMRTVEAIKNCL